MDSLLNRNSSLLATRGIIAIILGIMVLVWPVSAAVAVVYLLGAFVLVDGVFALFAAFNYRATSKRWWALLIEGALGLAAGLIAFFMPGAAIVALVLLFGAWAVVSGILQIAWAADRSIQASDTWLYMLGGALSVLGGLLIAFMPGIGMLALTYIIGAYAIIFGIAMLAMAMRMRHGKPLFEPRHRMPPTRGHPV